MATLQPNLVRGIGAARRYGGAGLGLANVARVAKAMHGGLTVASRPGGGCAFRLAVTVDAVAPLPTIDVTVKKSWVVCAVLPSVAASPEPATTKPMIMFRCQVEIIFLVIHFLVGRMSVLVAN